MNQSEMNNELRKIKQIAYDPCSLTIAYFIEEPESQEYKACKFKLNDLDIIYRNAKITPKKIGQFVAVWKRNEKGTIEPYKETDPIDFYVITASKENRIGQFIFPKSVLVEKGILSTSEKDGKRGFRVYPIWDTAANRQAVKTQKWQLEYFVEYNTENDRVRMMELFNGK